MAKGFGEWASADSAEWKSDGASEFRTKAKPTIAHAAQGSIVSYGRNTGIRLTKRQFSVFCVKDAEQATRDLAPHEALGILEQQSE